MPLTRGLTWPQLAFTGPGGSWMPDSSLAATIHLRNLHKVGRNIIS